MAAIAGPSRAPRANAANGRRARFGVYRWLIATEHLMDQSLSTDTALNAISGDYVKSRWRVHTRLVVACSGLVQILLLLGLEMTSAWRPP